MKNLIRVYEKYKHLDWLLSDMRWYSVGITDEILFDLWAAVKAAVAYNQDEEGE